MQTYWVSNVPMRCVGDSSAQSALRPRTVLIWLMFGKHNVFGNVWVKHWCRVNEMGLYVALPLRLWPKGAAAFKISNALAMLAGPSTRMARTLHGV
eukprot:7176006-Pyramimonas_sp.AAC.1